MQCEIYFSHEKNFDYKMINDHLDSISEPKQIVTDNLNLHDFFKKKKINSKMLEQNIDAKDLDDIIYKKTKILHEEYRKAFKDLSHNGISIFSGFDNLLFRQLIVLFKAEKILEEKKNIIFIFNGYFPIFFAIKKMAKEMGYISSNTIWIIEKNKINLLNNYSTEKVQNNVSKKRIYKFLKYSFGKDISLNNFKILFSVFNEITSLLIKKITSKIFNLFNMNSNELLLKKIHKKIKLQKNPEILFFITTSRADLHLNPWIPVIELLKNNATSYKIFTSDLASSSILSNEKIQFMNLFTDVKILENEIEKFNFWNEINLKIREIVTKNKLIIGMDELLDYFLKQTRRTVSIFLIFDIIINTYKIKSIIAMADGEMLENIAVEYAKKIDVQSFSFVPGYNTPVPYLSEWFKVNSMFVTGLDSYDTMIKLNYSEKKLKLSGDPKYDFFKSIKSDDSKNVITKQFQLDIKKPLIVLAMSRWWNDDEIWISNFIKYCNKNNFQIIIKLHPVYKIDLREFSDRKIRKISENCSNNQYTILYDADLFKLLSAADVVITDFSNIGIDTILLERPLLTVNFSNENFENIMQYDKYDSSINIQIYLDLEKIVKEILIEQKHLEKLSIGRKKIIELINYKNDGKAAERIFKSITK
jgi:hypothetical protein